ncbi:MAG TPA: sigma-54 dependent transcriptional regulator [Phycisphaerales bacterium]|nr:sigma-54 dependent transcriptional regulator [Phycisphaerales bacterium]
MAKILVIEDEENLRFTIRKALTKAGYGVVDVACLAAARKAMQDADFDVVLSDVMLGAHDNGLDFVRELRSDSVGFDGTVVVMTAFSSMENAIAAMRMGADDYLQKPLSLEELGLQVGRWIEHRRLARKVRLYERLEKSREREWEAVGRSPAWRSTLSMADRLAAIPLPTSDAGKDGGDGRAGLPCILITGETGVGKGVLARYIHQRACEHAEKLGAKEAADAPFVHVNCSALPATLVEGELFGHERGAFTDAKEARAGLFEMADGGTIFLDEVSETPLEFQAKLLTVLEHGVYRRVGGTKERRVRVRVIAASNQDLEDRVKAAVFRRDLLYRLNAFTVRIAPLRERGQDAVLIAEVMIERLGRRYGRPNQALSEAAGTAILSHDWPGNVRELVNAAQRAVMLSDDPEIEPEDLGLNDMNTQMLAVPRASYSTPPHDRNGRASEPLAHAGPTAAPGDGAARSDITFDFERGLHKAADVEKELIMQALRFTKGNVSRAAKLIGMQRSSMRYRIDRYGLEQYVVEVANR